MDLLLDFYGYLLPFVLYASWTALAFWDIAQRHRAPAVAGDGPAEGAEVLGNGATVAWILVVLLVPFLGVVAYLLAGGSRLPMAVRGGVIGGGLIAYALVIALNVALR